MDHLISSDPFTRFLAIQDALIARGDWRDDATWQRFAALTGTLCPLEPAETARLIAAAAQVLRERSGWYSDLSTSQRFVVAAVLVADGIDPLRFLHELDADHGIFRDLEVRHGGHYETLAILILRHLDQGRPLARWRVERLKLLYEGLKGYHWWLTGPDDLPACACLTAVPGDPDRVAAVVDQHYRQLHHRGFARGNHLLIASSLLALGGREPGDAVERFAAIAESLGRAEASVWHQDYEAIAMLAMLDQEPDLVASRHREVLTRFAALQPPLAGQAAINLAAHLVAIDLLRSDERGIRPHSIAAFTTLLQRLNRLTAAALLLDGGGPMAGTDADWPLGSGLYPLGGGVV